MEVCLGCSLFFCKSHEIYSQAMWGAPAPPPREATPPPPVERLPGYLEVTLVKVFQSVFQLMFLGAGQSDSDGQTCIWQWRNQRCRVSSDLTPSALLYTDLIRGVLGIGLPKLSAVQGALLQRAKKYAMEV